MGISFKITMGALVGLGGFSVLQCLPALADEKSSEVPSLKEAYSKYFMVGTAIGTYFENDEQIKDLVARQFMVLTPENCMKPQPIQPEEGKYSFEHGDRLVEFAAANNLKVVGHTFVWQNQTPDWFFKGPDGKQAPRELVLKRLKDHITTVMTHYKGKIIGWDVVNEAVIDGKDGFLKPNNPWFKCVGPDFIEKAFEYAYEADPNVELYYNDYNTEKPNKRAKVIEIIRGLKKKGLRIDGVGIQGHWGVNFPIKDIEDSIIAFKECGVKVMITELDMNVLPGKPDGAEITDKAEWQEKLDPYRNGCPDGVLKKQASEYASLFKMLMKYQGTVTRVTFWGFSDKHSWLNNWPIKGRTNYGVIFDRDMKPKPAFYAIINAAKDSQYDQGGDKTSAKMNKE